ncbi:winged helix-turn-helix domain-containing protein [Georgenia ruanii]|uniref:Uncharacterized protein n=1 Tax=Georgenia ruanii TaxID=348442 RepID=A0A7J9UYI5_9MICO|nr:hypothetical protein [Georgenia ruanii]MPV88734.1 hypothetical protein [Georgenia ruanii]
MFVVTADQHASTAHGDKVADLLDALAAWGDRPPARGAVALPLERTVGDEVQTVLTTAEAALDLALHLMRLGEWAVGIGAGPVNEPLAATSRASSGPAFVHARNAVERARGRGVPAPVVVAGEDAEAAGQATALVQLLASVVRRRSAAGWEVADLLEPGVRQKDVAARLGISEQAVSQRVRSALLEEEMGVRPLAAAVIERAAGAATGEDEGSAT